MRERGLAFAPVNHREEIVRPAGASRALVAQRNEIMRRERAGDPVQSVIGNVPDHHGVCSITEMAMTQNDPEARHDAGTDKRRQARQNVRFAPADTARDLLKRTVDEVETVLDRAE